jgi:hypothetical protein
MHRREGYAIMAECESIRTVYASVVFLVLLTATVFSLQRTVNDGKKLQRCWSIPESVLESPRYILQVPHPSGTGGLSALSLLTPLI